MKKIGSLIHTIFVFWVVYSFVKMFLRGSFSGQLSSFSFMIIPLVVGFILFFVFMKNLMFASADDGDDVPQRRNSLPMDAPASYPKEDSVKQKKYDSAKSGRDIGTKEDLKEYERKEKEELKRLNRRDF